MIHVQYARIIFDSFLLSKDSRGEKLSRASPDVRRGTRENPKYLENCLGGGGEDVKTGSHTRGPKFCESPFPPHKTST